MIISQSLLVSYFLYPWWICILLHEFGVSVVIGFCQTENSGTIVKLFIT